MGAVHQFEQKHLIAKSDLAKTRKTTMNTLRVEMKDKDGNIVLDHLRVIRATTQRGVIKACDRVQSEYMARHPDWHKINVSVEYDKSGDRYIRAGVR